MAFSVTTSPALSTTYVSSPVPPIRVSAPVPPSRISLPAPPVSVLAPLFPMRMLSNALPVPASPLAPVRVRFSTFEPKV
ncbi:hypothetical protein B9N43_00605 [Denitratisoma sp. DHT3]|nr:hypothetical protein B9N43_00605 [Denitratisoma sp. DHT3]